MIRTTQARPTMEQAVRNASIAAEITDAINEINSALGRVDERIAEMVMADMTPESWRHLSVDVRRVHAADYAAAQIQMMRRST